jgi:hypothetical protein
VLLERQVRRFEFTPADLAGRGYRSPLLALMFLTLRARGAKDPSTLGRLALTERGVNRFVDTRNVFPKTTVEAYARKSEIDEIANYLLVNNSKRGVTDPTKRLKELLDTHGPQFLTAHCLPVDPELWKPENYLKFLEMRRAALADAFNQFLAEHTQAEPAIDLAALLAGGESATVEFKEKVLYVTESSRNRPHTLVREVAAFANSKGGTVLIGVSDDGRVPGIAAEVAADAKGRDGFQQNIFSRIIADIGPAAASAVQLSFEAYGDAEVCVVRVPPSPSPVYVKHQGNNLLFTRLGNQAAQLDAREVQEYCAKRWPS